MIFIDQILEDFNGHLFVTPRRTKFPYHLSYTGTDSKRCEKGPWPRSWQSPATVTFLWIFYRYSSDWIILGWDLKIFFMYFLAK